MVKIGAGRLLKVYFVGIKSHFFTQLLEYSLNISFRILETPTDMEVVEELQILVWPDSERDIVPAHMLVTAVNNGGLLIGAFSDQDSDLELIGFVFGFPGLYFTPDGPRPKHCSHMMGVHPEYRDHGIGFTLKRAQWQMVRHQGLDRITWTYDPLQSRNANLNIAKLGAVCDTYIPEYYGQMRDGLNVGVPSDRFQVDWWVNSQRVNTRLSKRARRKLDLAHYLAAGVEVLNPTEIDDGGWPKPSSQEITDASDNQLAENISLPKPLLLVEIPPDYQSLKDANPDLALNWRLHIRSMFQFLFKSGYLVTDFVYLGGSQPRSYYVLSHGESTL